jgi:hypothetical protein
MQYALVFYCTSGEHANFYRGRGVLIKRAASHCPCDPADHADHMSFRSKSVNAASSTNPPHYETQLSQDRFEVDQMVKVKAPPFSAPAIARFVCVWATLNLPASVSRLLLHAQSRFSLG